MTKLAAVVANNAKFDLSGKLAVVAGGTAGIGEAIAHRLARANASVIIAGRSEEAGQNVVAELKRVCPSGNHGFVRLDASLMANVRAFAEPFRRSGNPVHYLVMTQGIATMQGRTETKEGLDVKMALHYYSRVLLASEMAPLLEKAAAAGGDARVLSVLSGGPVHKANDLDLSDLELARTYNLKNAANAAGFYNDLGFDALAARHPTVGFLHAAPGFIATKWGADFNFVLRGAVRGLQALLADKAGDCGEFMFNALTNPEMARGFHAVHKDGQRGGVTPQHTEENRARVWTHTEELLARTTKPQQ